MKWPALCVVIVLPLVATVVYAIGAGSSTAERPSPALTLGGPPVSPHWTETVPLLRPIDQ
jgi:hypothetical protein